MGFDPFFFAGQRDMLRNGKGKSGAGVCVGPECLGMMEAPLHAQVHGPESSFQVLGYVP